MNIFGSSLNTLLMNAEKQNKYSSSRTVCLTLNGKSVHPDSLR